jgi:hypothetical protein
MSENVVPYGDVAQGAAITNRVGSEDPFETIFRPAKPALDAVIELREPLRWLDQRRRSRRPLFDPKRASELINIIPDGNRLAKAGALFLEAEEQPAPEQWLHLAIAVMLDSEPGCTNVPGAFRFAVADGAYRDEEIWEHHRPGFSAAVIARSIRSPRPQPGKQ